MTLSKRANSRQPSFGRICPSDADQREFSDAKQTGRKSSLATSLHTIANRTFQPTPRRTKAGDGRVPAPATPVWRQTPARFPLSTSPSNRPVSGPRPATSTTTRVPSRDLGIPPVPALPPRSGSRIPTLSQAPAPTALGKRPKSKVGSSAVESRPVVGSEVKRPTVCPPPQKPFVEYQDVQLLSGLSISKARRKHEDAGQEEEGDSAGSTSFRKPTMPFSRGTTASFATPKKGRMSSRSLPRSVTMATLAPSRRVTEIPPAPSLQSLHALTENRVKAAITRGVRVVTGNRNRQPPSCTPVCAASVAGTESRASTTCELNERGLPLPPIPAFPKSYSTGNLRIDSTLDKTPKAARMQRERDSTRNHPHGTPRSTVTRTQGSPMNTAPNCYVTGALSSQIQRITEPLIDLTPPRQTHPRTSESPQSVSTLVSSDGYEHLEDSIQLVTERQPEQYWLGRFSTLMNSFQYEEAFKETDPFIGYRAPSRRKFLRSCGIEGIDEFNIKRAFTALERRCKTTEASKSFLEFKEAFERSFTKSGSPKPIKTKDSEARHTSIRADIKAVVKKKSKEMNVAENSGESGVRYLIKSVRRSLL